MIAVPLARGPLAGVRISGHGSNHAMWFHDHRPEFGTTGACKHAPKMTANMQASMHVLPNMNFKPALHDLVTTSRQYAGCNVSRGSVLTEDRLTILEMMAVLYCV